MIKYQVPTPASTCPLKWRLFIPKLIILVYLFTYFISL